MTLNPLEQLNLITMAATAAIFLVTLFLLRRVFFLPLLKVMEKRERKLELARLKYKEASALLQKAREEAKRILAEATEETRHLTGSAEEEVMKIQKERRARADGEAEKISVAGREEVSRLKEREQAKMKAHLLTCSRQTLVKLIGEVDEDTLRFVVSRVLMAKGAAK
jgi:F-type H+-transporting ATPase subunit b